MTIHVLRGQATREQVNEMLEALEDYVKLAVDIRRGIAAGGGIRYEALINIRPRQDNPAVKILDEARQEQVAKVVRRLLAGTE